ERGGGRSRSGGHNEGARNVSGGAAVVSVHMGTARGAERASARRRGPLGSERGESSGGGPDANLGAAVQDGRVGESRGTVELAVTLVAGSDPVRGSVRLGGGHRREFWGWL